MKIYYITFRSVTYAQRGEKLLAGAGIRCAMQRTPRWMEGQGCGYALRIWTDDPGGVMKRLRDGAVPLRRIYRQKSEGQLEEIRL